MSEDLSLSILTILIPVLVTFYLTPRYISWQKLKNAVTVNYQGTRVVTGGGLILLAAVSAVQFFHLFFLQEIQYPGILMFLYLGGITFLGIFDDLKGENSYKGFQGHLQRFWQGKGISTGLYKATGGLLLGIIVSALLGGGSWGEWLLKGIFLALFSNLFNLLDTRPARAAKFFFLFSLISVLIYKMNILPFIVLWSTLYIYLFWELKHKVMLGDAGAYLLGGVLGLHLTTVTPLKVLLSLTSLLVVLHYLGERFSFSEILDNKILLFSKGGAGRRS